MMSSSTSISKTLGEEVASEVASSRREHHPEPRTGSEGSESEPTELVLLVIDASGSMADDGKVDALDHSVMALVERLERSTRRQYVVGAITFGPNDMAAIHREPAPADELLRWPQLTASGSTPLGSGLTLAADVAGSIDVAATSVVLLTDGFPTDDWSVGFDHLASTVPDARRFAVGIGVDADISILKEFASPPTEHHVVSTEEVIDIPGLIESLDGWLAGDEDRRATYVPYAVPEVVS